MGALSTLYSFTHYAAYLPLELGRTGFMVFQLFCKPKMHGFDSATMGPLLVQDMLRPLYMQPQDALEYGVIDKILTKDDPAIDSVKGASAWDKDAGLVQRPAPTAPGPA